MFYSDIECAKKRQNNKEIELKKKIEKGLTGTQISK